MHYVYGHFDVRPISLYRLFKALSVIVAMLAFDKYGKVYCIAIITGFSGHKIPWQKVTANKVQIFQKKYKEMSDFFTVAGQGEPQNMRNFLNKSLQNKSLSIFINMENSSLKLGLLSVLLFDFKSFYF